MLLQDLGQSFQFCLGVGPACWIAWVVQHNGLDLWTFFGNFSFKALRSKQEAVSGSIDHHDFPASHLNIGEVQREDSR